MVYVGGCLVFSMVSKAQREANERWRLRNPEKIREYNRRYREKNRGRYNAYQVEYRKGREKAVLEAMRLQLARSRAVIQGHSY